jgi:uncharacterized protein YutE (UPF0331/DUF86 family)
MAQIALDDFGKLAVEKYVTTVEDYNRQVLASKSVDSIEDFKEQFQTSWEGVADINAKIEQLESALEDLLAKRMLKVEPVLSAEYAKALEASGVNPEALKELLKTINGTKKYLVMMYGEAVLEDTPKVEARRSAAGGNAGTGGRRIRGFDVYIDGTLAAKENAKGEMKSTFSIAAKELGVETTELQRAFFEAAKSEDVKSDDFPQVVDFVFKDKEIRVSKDDSDDDSE